MNELIKSPEQQIFRNIPSIAASLPHVTDKTFGHMILLKAKKREVDALMVIEIVQVSLCFYKRVYLPKCYSYIFCNTVNLDKYSKAP